MPTMIDENGVPYTPKDPTPRNKWRKAMKDVHSPAKLKTLRQKSRNWHETKKS